MTWLGYCSSGQRIPEKGKDTFSPIDSFYTIKSKNHPRCGFDLYTYTRDQPQPGYFLEVGRERTLGTRLMFRLIKSVLRSRGRQSDRLANNYISVLSDEYAKNFGSITAAQTTVSFRPDLNLSLRWTYKRPSRASNPPPVVWSKCG